MSLLKADARYPVVLPDGTEITNTVQLKNVINHPRIEIGDYSYANNLHKIDNWASTLAPYLFPFSREKLVIGKFCQLAHGAVFVTSSANHPMGGFSTYPFRMFNPKTMADYLNLPSQDTVVGHDVWIGYSAIIMPGVTIGSGAIIASGSVVTKSVSPYTVVGGNPARALYQRFPDAVVVDLLEIKWWDWPTGKIEANLSAIEGADIDALKAV